MVWVSVVIGIFRIFVAPGLELDFCPLMFDYLTSIPFLPLEYNFFSIILGLGAFLKQEDITSHFQFPELVAPK